MTFLITKRINTELFIDRNMGLYILWVDEETDQDNLLIRKTDGQYNWLLGRGQNSTGSKSKCASENTAACIINDLPKSKERQT